MVLLIAAQPRSADSGSASGNVVQRLAELAQSEGLSEKDALKRIARERGLAKSELWRELQRERARGK